MNTKEEKLSSPAYFQGIKVDPRFIIRTPFRNKKGKVDLVPILNFDGHLDVAHQMGLVLLTTDILKWWEETFPAGLDEDGQPKTETISWVAVRATVIIRKKDGSEIKATGFNVSNDRDPFVKKPEYLLAVAETRAQKRAIYNACGITEREFYPDGKEATRESVDLPLHPGDVDEEPSGIPHEVRKKGPNITPPISRVVEHSPPVDFNF